MRPAASGGRIPPPNSRAGRRSGLPDARGSLVPDRRDLCSWRSLCSHGVDIWAQRQVAIAHHQEGANASLRKPPAVSTPGWGAAEVCRAALRAAPALPRRRRMLVSAERSASPERCSKREEQVSEYKTLESRLAAKEVVILDGAVGTQLQKMGVPMSGLAWAATALQTHPYTVRLMHEHYIRAGVDIITVNSYSAARHNLVPIALGDMTRELNLRAVVLAQEARDRCAKERPVYIAGSVSNYGMRTGSELTPKGEGFFTERVAWTEEASKANLREQAEILAESGVDLLLVESTGGTTHRRWVLEACLSTGLPVWVGFKCHLDAPGGPPKTGYHSDEPLAAGIEPVLALGGDAVTIFHSAIAATDAALPLLRARWPGPLGIYPEAERHDYIATHKDAAEPDHVTPAAFVAKAKAWVDSGVQIIGGCCGIELEHIRPLRDALPKRLPGA